MGSDALASPQLPPALLRDLADHLQLTGSNHSAMQAVTNAVRAWIAVDQAHQPPLAATSRGYQWKTLFLPDATELRMSCGDNNFYARVIGDHIMYEGRSVSPRGMTLAVAGEGRNAWRDLWLKLPGERYWKQAICCRNEHQRSLRQAPESPVQAMAAAATAMSDALKTALVLVEHANLQSAKKLERRAHQQRRKSDIADDDCAFG